MPLMIRLEPAKQRRLKRPGPRKLCVTDGPFAETKELVLGSSEEAIAEGEARWCDRVK